jgi:hypothetical protein
LEQCYKLGACLVLHCWRRRRTRVSGCCRRCCGHCIHCGGRVEGSDATDRDPVPPPVHPGLGQLLIATMRGNSSSTGWCPCCCGGNLGLGGDGGRHLSLESCSSAYRCESLPTNSIELRRLRGVAQRALFHNAEKIACATPELLNEKSHVCATPTAETASPRYALLYPELLTLPQRPSEKSGMSVCKNLQEVSR